MPTEIPVFFKSFIGERHDGVIPGNVEGNDSPDPGNVSIGTRVIGGRLNPVQEIARSGEEEHDGPLPFVQNQGTVSTQIASEKFPA